MLQEVDAGRKTEVEMFGAKIVELGKIHNISTPVNKAILQIIRVLAQVKCKICSSPAVTIHP